MLQGNLCHYPTEVWKLFPEEQDVESYFGIPLLDVEGNVLSHLAVFDSKPMPKEPQLVYTLKIFAAKAAAELSRIQIVAQLHQSEERFRDLFEEAPIAYVRLSYCASCKNANLIG